MTVLKRLPKAHAALAELKGIASTMPNQGILINTLGLLEAKDSSAIGNIITTYDHGVADSSPAGPTVDNQPLGVRSDWLVFLLG